MASPKTTPIMNSGSMLTMADGCSTPNTPPNHPHWKTATTAPNVARTLSRNPRVAVNGTSSGPEDQGEHEEREPDDDQQVGQERVAQLPRRCRW